MAKLLNCFGAQDVYLSGNPEMTLFGKDYARLTHFVSKNENFFKKSQKFGSILEVEIPNKSLVDLKTDNECGGDLLNGLTLFLDLPPNNVYKKDVDCGIIDYAEIYVDETCIQKITGDYIKITNKLLYPHDNTVFSNNQIVIDLPFWFKDIGNSFPMICLKNKKVWLKIKFRDLKNVTKKINHFDNTFECNIAAKYVYLDMEEKRSFLRKDNISLIKTIHYHDLKSDQHIEINAENHLVDFYFFYSKEDNEILEYKSLAKNVELSIDTNQIASFPKMYYTFYQQSAYTNSIDDVYVYSFSLDPAKHIQPTGFNKNNCKLTFKLDVENNHEEYTFKFISRNYSILVVKNNEFELDTIQSQCAKI